MRKRPSNALRGLGMTISANRWFDFGPLRHRLWWLALVVLLVNDNLLKGAGIVPGWLTGKLSDFAFIVVAPVLLTTLLPMGWPGRRALAFATVAAVFCAADLSPAASEAIVTLAARVGLAWRLWPDVTDLVALSMLPLAWWIAGRRTPDGYRRGRSLLEVGGIALGALACLATGAPEKYRHFPFFVNRTATARNVELTWLLRKTECTADLPALAATLSPGDLDDPHAVALASGQVTALDVPPAPTGVMAGTCNNLPATYTADPECMAAVVAVAGGPAVLVSSLRHWSVSAAEKAPLACSTPAQDVSTCAAAMPVASDPGKDALSLVDSNGRLEFTAGARLRMTFVDPAAIALRASSAPGCRDRLEQFQTLVELAKECTTDADCQVLNADLAVPGRGVCNVYVNRSLTFATLVDLRDTWNRLCATDDTFVCSGQVPVQPAACHAGRCGPLCPDVALEPCRSCASMHMAVEYGCAGRPGASCVWSDGRFCTCQGSPIDLVCVAPSAARADCPIACLADFPIASEGPNAYRADAAAVDSAFDVQTAPDSAPADAASSEAVP
jgi:hypothetical protein